MTLGATAAAPESAVQSVEDYLAADEVAAKQAASAAEPTTSPPSAGNPDGASIAAPGSGQPESGNENGQPQASPDDEVRQALGLSSPTETADVWKTKFQASSTEARSLRDQLTGVEDSLKAIGLKAVTGKEGVKFIADDNFVASNTERLAGEVFDALSQDDRDAAVEDPRRLVDKVARMVVEKTARPVPTGTRDDIVIDDGQKAAVRAELLTAKTKDGNPRFEGMEELEPYMQLVLDDPTTPDEFRSFASRSADNYRFAMQLLYGRAQHRVAPILARQKQTQAELDNKRQQAMGDASPQPGQNSGTRGMGGSGGPADESSEIAGATSLW